MISNLQAVVTNYPGSLPVLPVKPQAIGLVYHTPSGLNRIHRGRVVFPAAGLGVGVLDADRNQPCIPAHPAAVNIAIGGHERDLPDRGRYRTPVQGGCGPVIPRAATTIGSHHHIDFGPMFTRLRWESSIFVQTSWWNTSFLVLKCGCFLRINNSYASINAKH